MIESVVGWKLRKHEQAQRLFRFLPNIQVDFYGDYGTKFVAIDQDRLVAVIFGQLPWNDMGQKSIDLTDEQVIALFEKQKVA